MSRRAKVDWVVIDANLQAYRCTRCGGTEALRMPVPATAFVLRARAFEEEHRYCEKPVPAAAAVAPAKEGGS